MNISEVKTKLGVETLNLNTTKNADGTVYTKDGAQWMRHWDNDNRVAISIPRDLVETIKKDNPTTLAIQTETKQAEKGEYTAHRIVMHKPSEMSL